jgi:hypothetical protein
MAASVKINLAPAKLVCFSAFNLQLERKTFVAKSALAGLLAFLLLISSALAVGSAHRQSHDVGGGAPSHPCALCLFTHGQITLSDVSPPSVSVSAAVTGIVAPFHSTIPASMDYRLSPSRAPPV